MDRYIPALDRFMDANKENLLRSALNGDPVALQTLLLENYSNLSDSLRRRIPAALRTTIDEEDLLQSTFVHVFRNLDKFREGGVEAFYAWVRSIAYARVSDAIRSATRQKRGGGWDKAQGEVANSAQSYFDLVQLLSDDRRSPSKSAAAHEAVSALQVSLASLPEDQRQAIWLRYIEHLTIVEVVEEMGRTEAAVRGLLHRGKANLRESMGHSSTWFSQVE